MTKFFMPQYPSCLLSALPDIVARASCSSTATIVHPVLIFSEGLTPRKSRTFLQTEWRSIAFLKQVSTRFYANSISLSPSYAEAVLPDHHKSTKMSQGYIER
jgi:hypothetical protein